MGQELPRRLRVAQPARPPLQGPPVFSCGPVAREGPWIPRAAGLLLSLGPLPLPRSWGPTEPGVHGNGQALHRPDSKRPLLLSPVQALPLIALQAPPLTQPRPAAAGDTKNTQLSAALSACQKACGRSRKASRHHHHPPRWGTAAQFGRLVERRGARLGQARWADPQGTRPSPPGGSCQP